MEPLLVYFSSSSLNTHRFVQKVGMDAVRIPTSLKATVPLVDQPYILICPTYAGDDGRGAVPKQVIRFLNERSNREHLIGVIASGSRNFGKYFAYAGKVISEKCGVPFLFKFELMGTPEDVAVVRQGVARFFAAQVDKMVDHVGV